MINSVNSSALLGDPREDRRPPRKPSPEGAHAPSAGSAGDPADIRLIIEQDQASGAMTYKLYDRATGQIVSAVSREELMRIGADPSYAAGRVIDAKA